MSELSATCPNSHRLSFADPEAPTPGGVVGLQCPECGEQFEVENPAGDETYYFDAETWLIPKVEKVEGARNTTRNVVVGYTTAEPGDVGAVRFLPGEGVQRRLLDKTQIEEGGEGE